jgi:hypothetical protein
VDISVNVHIYNFRIAICFPANRELLRANYRERREMITGKVDMSLAYTHTYIHTYRQTDRQTYIHTYIHKYIHTVHT